jgi:hypothetical protein
MPLPDSSGWRDLYNECAPFLMCVHLFIVVKQCFDLASLIALSATDYLFESRSGS